MSTYTFKNLSRTAKVIVEHLLAQRSGSPLCPTTGWYIPLGQDVEWVKKLHLKGWGQHYIWLGFSYILVMEPTSPPLYEAFDDEPSSSSVDRVNIYQQGTINLIGHALSSNGLFTHL